MHPDRENALAEYFEHAAEQIRINRPDLSDATYSCVCFFAHIVKTDDVIAAFDSDMNRIELPIWHNEQKNIVDKWQSVAGTKEDISLRIADCGLEEYEELWSIGEGEQFDYASREAFMADVDWDYLLSITKNCWNIVCLNS